MNSKTGVAFSAVAIAAQAASIKKVLAIRVTTNVRNVEYYTIVKGV